MTKPGVPRAMPLLPLRNSVFFPHQVAPLSIGREASLQVVDEAMKMAATIEGKAPLAVAYAKRSMNHARHADTISATEMEANLFGLCFATQDQREGMTAFVEKRQPQFQGR